MIKRTLVAIGIAAFAAVGGSLIPPFAAPGISGAGQEILGHAHVDPATLAILQRACLNCHSEATEWPWYSRVAPVSWLIAHDVQEARSNKNLSHWQDYSVDERLRLLSAIGSAVKNREMPVRRYVLLHPEARLSDAERQQIYSWTRAERSRLRARPAVRLYRWEDQMADKNITPPSRRGFLFAGFTVLGPASMNAQPQTRALETVTQWLEAPTSSRSLALHTCLDRIRDLDPSIHAWVQVSPEKGSARGRLAGIPYGVKDIVETKGLATEYGSPIYKGRIGTTDAAIIREMRKHGALLLGKTQTTAFAYSTPAPTRNPRNLEYTPGGSSSGSAAAVAANMVPFTIGEQTRGSVLRPASFCGVTGFKPTFDLLPMQGVLPLSKSLDTLGFFTHTPADMLSLWDALGHSVGRAEDFDLGVPQPMQNVEPAMAAAFESAVRRLSSAGLTIRPLDIAGTLARLADANLTVMLYEGARFHKERYQKYGERLADLADLVRQGLQISVDHYDETRRYIDSCRNQFVELFKRTPVILTPAAMGPAPLGLASTGDPTMNAPWTALGTPAISIPMPVGKALPLGLQLTAASGDDARLLRTAVRLQNMLGTDTLR
jgi:Asp-tRNA(Asn)/Glu-tRNA(Gln) amidotransferase A subunit family amidase